MPTPPVLSPAAFAVPFALGIGLLAIVLLAVWNLRLRASFRRHRAESQSVCTQLQRDLHLAERRYRQVLDNAGDALFFIDPKTGTLLEINRRAEELLGYGAQEISSLSLDRLFPGHQHRRYLRLVRKVLSHGYGQDHGLHFCCKDGRIFTGAVHARLGALGDKEVVHGALRDISQIKQTERELRRKNRDLTLMNRVAHLTAGASHLDQMLALTLEDVVKTYRADGGGILRLHHQEQELTLAAHLGLEAAVISELRRLPPEQGLAGRVLSSGAPQASPDLQKDRRLYSAAARAAGWSGFLAAPLVADEKASGVLFLLYRARHSLLDDEIRLLVAIGEQLGTAVKGIDLFQALQGQMRLTEAVNRELESSRQQLRVNLRQLEEANQSLARLEQMKSQFLALASHELRTPLTYILSASDLLTSQLGQKLSADENRMLKAIAQGGQRLEEIVQDLLEMARLETRSLYLACEPVDLPGILEELQQEFQAVFARRELTFHFQPFPATRPLLGDFHHLRQTFRRLLQNAVKFTPSGGSIELSACMVPLAAIQEQAPALQRFSPGFFTALADRKSGFLQITLRDSGIGIDPIDHLRIFDKFYEVGEINRHFTSRYRFGGKGVGLGLALVKGMVEAHGGMVWVESFGTRQTSGSAFHLLLPLAAQRPDPSGTLAQPPAAEP